MACSQLEQRVQKGLARRRQEHEVILKSSKSVEQRRQQIVAWVKEHGQSQVEDLAVRFATSEVTIRKDLAALSQQGLLIRQFGGAVPTQMLGHLSLLPVTLSRIQLLAQQLTL